MSLQTPNLNSMDLASDTVLTAKETSRAPTRQSWLRWAWRLWVVALVLTLGHWVYPMFYRKPLEVDSRRVMERDAGLWSTKVAGTSASLDKAPVFGVFLVIDGEHMERRVSRFAALSRHAERHSAFFIKPGGEFLYWTLGPGKNWTPDKKVTIMVPVDSSRWVLGCGLIGFLLSIYQWSAIGWKMGARRFGEGLVTVEAKEVI